MAAEMRVVALRDDHLPQLYAIYREVTATAAHCRFVPSPAHFAASLAAPAVPGTRLFVAEQGGRGAGFTALLAPRPGDGAPQPEASAGRAPEAELTALFVGDERAGQALLDACTAHARSLGARRLLAFPVEHGHGPIPSYNASWGGLSDRQPLVARLLTSNGFAPYHRELHLGCDGERFPPPPPPGVPPPSSGSGAPSRVEPAPRATRDGVQIRPGVDRHGRPCLRALHGEAQLGICVYGTLEHLTDDPAAARWGYIWWLHVQEEHRRRGWGRRLLAGALAALAARGAAGCWLTTASDNFPAQALYLALGFEIVDASAAFGKDLR
jgi:ribosomal protein S18 acetylase RimI-like enzyme